MLRGVGLAVKLMLVASSVFIGFSARIAWWAVTAPDEHSGHIDPSYWWRRRLLAQGNGKYRGRQDKGGAGGTPPKSELLRQTSTSP